MPSGDADPSTRSSSVSAVASTWSREPSASAPLAAAVFFAAVFLAVAFLAVDFLAAVGSGAWNRTAGAPAAPASSVSGSPCGPDVVSSAGTGSAAAVLVVFLAAAFFAGAFFAAVFRAAVFFAGVSAGSPARSSTSGSSSVGASAAVAAFLAVVFFVAVFLAVVFLAAVFLAAVFFAGFSAGDSGVAPESGPEVSSGASVAVSAPAWRSSGIVCAPRPARRALGRVRRRPPGCSEPATQSLSCGGDTLRGASPVHVVSPAAVAWPMSLRSSRWVAVTDLPGRVAVW